MRARSPRREGKGFVPRRPLVGWALVAGVLLAGCARDLPQNALQPAGRIARVEDELWDTVFPIAVGVFILVQSAIIFAVIRYRRHKDDDSLPKQVAGNTRLEIIWTLIPALILVYVTFPTVQTIFQVAATPTGDPLEVRVIGKQYWWEFEYLVGDGDNVVTATELHIPTDRPVHLQMQSLAANIPDAGFGENEPPDQVLNGVIHSFWVPRLAGKQDVVPGHTRALTIEADDPGVYPGQCAEFCGLSHARMRFWVVAHEPDDFEAWLGEHQQPAFDGQEGLAAEGRRMFGAAGEQQCIACHAVDGYTGEGGQEATTRIGPNLTHFASRNTFAGGFLDVNEENVQAWLRDPPAVKAGAQMPDLGLSDEQIEALTAYLLSLE